MLDHDPLLAVDHADDLEAHARDGPRLDRARGDLDVLVGPRAPRGARRCRRASRPMASATSCDHRAPRQRRRARRRAAATGLVGLPEPHDLEHGERVVPGGVVDDLHHPDRRAPPCRGRGRAMAMPALPKPGVDARGVEATCRPPRRRPRAARGRRPGGRRVEQRHERRVHHVLARGQDPAEVVDHLVGADVGAGRVADAVGVEGEQRVGVLGGGHPDGRRRRRSRRRRGPPCRRVDPQAGELEVGVGDDGGHGVDADGPGRPLDHTLRHGPEPTVDPALAQQGVCS